MKDFGRFNHNVVAGELEFHRRHEARERAAASRDLEIADQRAKSATRGADRPANAYHSAYAYYAPEPPAGNTVVRSPLRQYDAAKWQAKQYDTSKSPAREERAIDKLRNKEARVERGVQKFEGPSGSLRFDQPQRARGDNRDQRAASTEDLRELRAPVNPRANKESALYNSHYPRPNHLAVFAKTHAFVPGGTEKNKANAEEDLKSISQMKPAKKHYGTANFAGERERTREKEKERELTPTRKYEVLNNSPNRSPRPNHLAVFAKTHTYVPGGAEKERNDAEEDQKSISQLKPARKYYGTTNFAEERERERERTREKEKERELTPTRKYETLNSSPNRSPRPNHLAVFAKTHNNVPADTERARELLRSRDASPIKEREATKPEALREARDKAYYGYYGEVEDKSVSQLKPARRKFYNSRSPAKEASTDHSYHSTARTPEEKSERSRSIAVEAYIEGDRYLVQKLAAEGLKRESEANRFKVLDLKTEIGPVDNASNGKFRVLLKVREGGEPALDDFMDINGMRIINKKYS